MNCDNKLLVLSIYVNYASLLTSSKYNICSLYHLPLTLTVSLLGTVF